MLRLSDPDGRLRAAVQDRIALPDDAGATEDFRMDLTVEAWLQTRGPSGPPVIDMREVGNRVVFDHVFLEGLPIIR